MHTGFFAALAEPTRLRLLDALATAEQSVGALSSALGIAQPTVSKHLKVLREAGFVACRTVAQQRVYRVEPSGFRSVDAWLEPYRRLWTQHLDALEQHLDALERS